MKAKPDPSPDRLRELFDYRDGDLLWRERPHKRSKSRAGDPAGTTHADGYRAILVDRKIYRAHRLVWVWHGRTIPEGMVIDHLNGQKGDNRIENLEVVTQRENTTRGRLITEKRSKLPIGVRFDSRCLNPYQARAVLGGKRHSLGYYATAEEAAAARDSFLSENLSECER